MAALAYAHWSALACFPGETVLVNKLTGTVGLRNCALK